MQETPEGSHKVTTLSWKIGKKILIIFSLFTIMVFGIPGIFIILLIVVTYILWAKKLFEGSPYSIKDLWNERAKEAWNYLSKRNKIEVKNSNSKTVISDASESDIASQVLNNSTLPVHKPDPETIKEDKKNIPSIVIQMEKTINKIVGIVIFSVFLLSILPQNQILNKIRLYFTNVFSRDKVNQQINASYILRIILAILIVFIIFMLVKALISYYHSDTKSPFNS